jgi:hypothetical protein
MLFDIIRRTIAVVILNVSGAFVGGSVIGIEVWQAGVMAAVAGVMGVAQELSRSYLADGMLDVNEINAAFGKAAGAPAKEATPSEDPKG